MGGEASVTDASTPGWQPVIMPDMALYSISACEPMTKGTEACQNSAENLMSGAPLFIWAPHAVSHVAVVGRAPAGMGGMPDAGGDVGRMSEMGGGTGVDSFHAIGDRG
jgi:hypothetical protein